MKNWIKATLFVVGGILGVLAAMAAIIKMGPVFFAIALLLGAIYSLIVHVKKELDKKDGIR
jgi:predicted membrane channel-forming protein YqfA (hemolysin III family)